MQRHMEIASIIRAQIFAAHGPFVPGSWGMRKLIAMPKTHRFGSFMEGGLKFYVSGRHFTGWVIVWLTCSDDYTVEFGCIRRGKWTTVETVDTVYCDMLTDVIDRRVENKAA
jgi:hypothetical protein